MYRVLGNVELYISLCYEELTVITTRIFPQDAFEMGLLSLAIPVIFLNNDKQSGIFFPEQA